MKATNNAVTLTPAIAWAAGTDAANARMRKARRSKWTRADKDHATEVTLRLFRAMGYPIPD